MQAFIVKLSFFPLVIQFSLERNLYAESPLKEWGVTLHLLEVGIFTWTSWNFSAWEVVSSLLLIFYSIMYLYQYGFMDIHFIFCVII